MASGEQDLARVAVGEILDSAPSDVRALLAQLELAFLDGRADEFGARARTARARGQRHRAARGRAIGARRARGASQRQRGARRRWFAAAAESDPASLAARLGAIRQAVARNDGEAAARALLDLARQVEATDPITAAALAVRAQQWAEARPPLPPRSSRSTAPPAIRSSRGSPPRPRARATIRSPPATRSRAGPRASTRRRAERAYAAARAAELDPARGAELWARALAHDPGDDYAAQQLRTAHVAAEATQLAIDVDLAVAADGERERARLRAAFGLIAQGQLDAAIDLLAARPRRASRLARADRGARRSARRRRPWSERAKLFAELAADPGEQLDRDVAQLRSALAWEEAVGAAAAVEPPDADEIQRATAAGARGVGARARGRARQLAGRARRRDRARAAARRSRRARRGARARAAGRALAVGRREPRAAPRAPLLASAPDPPTPPRRSCARLASRRSTIRGAPLALVIARRAPQRARRRRRGARGARDISSARRTESRGRALRLRAAQLALDAGDAARATALLGTGRAGAARSSASSPICSPPRAAAPAIARRRRRSRARRRAGAGRREPATRSRASSATPISRPRTATAPRALALYQRALELRPGDPLAAVPLVRVATQLREPAPIAALALAQLRPPRPPATAPRKADAYELLAHIDGELRDDPGSAQIALESASQADPTRIDLLHRLEREYAAADQLGELLRLRRAGARASSRRAPRAIAPRCSSISPGSPSAISAPTPSSPSSIAPRSPPIRGTARAAPPRVDRAPRRRLRRARRRSRSRSPRTSTAIRARQAAFCTRAGETLAEIGQIDAAVQRFGKADAVLPGHVPALEGWRHAALKGQLWIDVAEAATRQAAVATDADAQARGSITSPASR